jgi:hypothetical protein
MISLLSLVGSLLVKLSSSGCPSSSLGSGTSRNAQIIQDIALDMQRPHEGIPHGVPEAYGWTRKPRLAMGNNPGKFKSMVAWGQVYEAAEGNFSQNTRVQIKNMKAYQLSKSDKTWHLLQSSQRVEGAAYREDFQNNLNKKADVRREADGSISVKLHKNYNYHFWPSMSRANIDPRNIGGLIVTVYARLIPDRAQGEQDLSRARFILNVGGDYWSSQNANWDNFKTNGEIGMGRFKYLTKDWKLFSMTTLSQQELACYPPQI